MFNFNRFGASEAEPSLSLYIYIYIFDRIMDLIIPDNWGVYSSYTTIFFFQK